jgi:hypothetical protein
MSCHVHHPEACLKSVHIRLALAAAQGKGTAGRRMAMTAPDASRQETRVTADAPPPVDRLIAERDCERLIIDFVRRLDRGMARR